MMMTDMQLLQTQLRIAEIEGQLEQLHATLMDPFRLGGQVGRAKLVRQEIELRQERQSLCDELANRYPSSP